MVDSKISLVGWQFQIVGDCIRGPIKTGFTFALTNSNVPTKFSHRFSQIYRQKPNVIQNFQKIDPNVEF
jgi:hypothetical protein